MNYVPTVTSNFDKIDLSNYNEILLTPNRRTKTLIPINYKKNIIIDNGGFLINTGRYPKEYSEKHINICKELKNEENCIFVLPDILKDLEYNKKMIELFLKEVEPKRCILVHQNKYLESIFNIKPEFYAVSSRHAKNIILKERHMYHVFSTPNCNNSNLFRSFDSSKNIYLLKGLKYGL